VASPAGQDHADILKAYPYLEDEDVRQALAYAAWRTEEFDGHRLEPLQIGAHDDKSEDDPEVSVGRGECRKTGRASTHP
jgi:hypothetical protein